MKKFFALFISVFISTMFFAQHFEAKEKWSFMNTKYINVSVVPQYIPGPAINGYTLYPNSGTIDIDWGDLSPHDIIAFNHSECPSFDSGFAGSPVYYKKTFNHNYVSPGTYNTTVSVTDLSSNQIQDNNGNSISNLAITVLPNSNNMGFVGIKTLSCNGIDMSTLFPLGVPYNFTDNTGITTTIYPISNQKIDSASCPLSCYSLINFCTNSYYNSFNIYPIPMVNLPYTISINPGWTSSNGFINPNPTSYIPEFSPGNPILNPLPRYELWGSDLIWISDAPIWNLVSPPPNMNTPINGFFGFKEFIIDPISNNPTIPDFGFGFCNASACSIPQSGEINLTICNTSCGNTSNVNVQVQLPSIVTPILTGLTNPILSGTVLTFDILGLTGNGCTNITIPFTIPGGTPAGTPLLFDVLLSNANEINASNNLNSITCFVSNSLDPNFKDVNQPTFLNPQLTEELIYTIHFENEGNASAANIYVTDELSALLDLSTFKFLNTSHSCNYQIDTVSRVLTVNYNSINLLSNQVDAELAKGSFSYSLKEISSIQLNDTIKNQASIYFDFNLPLQTNYTTNLNYSAAQLVSLSSDSNLFQLFPNPSKNKLNINIDNSLLGTSYVLTDAIGRVLDSGNFKLNTNQLDLSSISNGVYRLHLDNGLYKQFQIIH
jgi:uncharacterized repeat protein (TIGR01451 family)